MNTMHHGGTSCKMDKMEKKMKYITKLIEELSKKQDLKKLKKLIAEYTKCYALFSISPSVHYKFLEVLKDSGDYESIRDEMLAFMKRVASSATGFDERIISGYYREREIVDRELLFGGCLEMIKHDEEALDEIVDFAVEEKDYRVMLFVYLGFARLEKILDVKKHLSRLFDDNKFAKKWKHPSVLLKAADKRIQKRLSRGKKK